MDTTTCLGLPYPQCDPPLTKDASDIEQLRDLALAVDGAVQELADTITDTLTSPDAANMTGALTAAGRIQDMPYTVIAFDNASMADTVAGRLEIQTDGWYMIGGWVRATSGVATGIGMRVQPTLNGDGVSARQGPGRPVLAGASATDEVAWSDSMHLSVGDLIGCRTNHVDAVGLSVTYSSSIWALLVLADD